MKRDDFTSVFGGLEGSSIEGQLEAIDLGYLLKEAGEAIVYVDENWVVRYCNDVYLANVGLPRSEVIGRTPFDYLPNFRRSIFYESIDQCRRDRKAISKIGYSTVLDRWLMVRVFPAGRGMMMLANDASESVVKQVQLAQKVVQDHLTGLPNKLGLVEDIEELQRRNGDFSLSLIGLDRFQSLNDALGYAGGDMGLLEVASRLQSASLPGEKLYRLNGDEFGLLRHQGLEGTEERVKALISTLAAPLVINGARFVVGASAGCVGRMSGANDAERLIKQAKLALNHAKKTSRGGVQKYAEGLEAASLLRAQLEVELRSALEANKFQLFLQPKGSLSGGGLIGAEALIRWNHPQRGIVSPGEFLPVASDCGLMGAIDRIVLRDALLQVQELRRNGLSIPVSINLSAESLCDECLVEHVTQALHTANVDARMLEIEIPEGALMANLEKGVKVIGALSEMGVRISIDDFGTGYSSFAYLARFPVNSLKVDRSFVHDLTSNGANQKIVKGMIRLAHSLQLEVVAEGAEGMAEIEMLTRLKCDMVQGYGYGKPMPLSKFIAFARAQPARPAMSAMSI